MQVCVVNGILLCVVLVMASSSSNPVASNSEDDDRAQKNLSLVIGDIDRLTKAQIKERLANLHLDTVYYVLLPSFIYILTQEHSGSTDLRQGSRNPDRNVALAGSPPKSNEFLPVTHRTPAQKFIKIRQQHFNYPANRQTNSKASDG